MTLVVEAADFKSFPEFQPTGWDGHLDARMTNGKCFAWVMDDRNMAVLPGKGNDRIKGRTPILNLLAGSNITLKKPPELPYEGTLESYAKKQWENVTKRDGLVPVSPDENGVMTVPKGTYPVFLAVRLQRNPVTQKMEGRRHWYRADRPDQGSKEVRWSHWDGKGQPERNAGPNKLTDPWKQCAFNKYYPVGYFLVTEKDANGASTEATTSSRAPQASSSPKVPVQ